VGNGFIFGGRRAAGNEDCDGRGVALEPEPCACLDIDEPVVEDVGGTRELPEPDCLVRFVVLLVMAVLI
jgi:hypothetical protein